MDAPGRHHCAVVDIARERLDPAAALEFVSDPGFGGITIHLVATDGAEEYAKRVQAGFKARTGIDAEYIICAIGDGATSRKL